MIYVNILFPPRLAFGLQRTASWSTAIAQVISGREGAAIQNWSDARHEYDASFAVRTVSDLETILDHFHSVRGRAKKWPLKDPLDYTVTVARGVLLDDGDSPTTGYQMAKRYGTGSDVYYRRITRPAQGTIAIYRLRAGVTTNITANCTIGYTDGQVAIASGAYMTGDVLSWSGQFFTPCRYDTDSLPSVAVNRNPGQAGELLVQCDSIPIIEALE
jgi:uncharacterized protein (TIGR02217 family)